MTFDKHFFVGWMLCFRSTFDNAGAFSWLFIRMLQVNDQSYLNVQPPNKGVPPGGPTPNPTTWAIQNGGARDRRSENVL